MGLRTRVCNVLVIGTGGAGYRSAIAACDAGKDVIILGKSTNRNAHTTLAAGGINAAMGNVDSEDSWEYHFADTMAEGYQLANAELVKHLAKNAPAAIEELASWGMDFNTTDDGKIDQRYFGAHRYRRTCYVHDYTGQAMINTLADKAMAQGIHPIENEYVFELLVTDGKCFGALAFKMNSGVTTAYYADAVILCTGGHTKCWSRSSSRKDENTGDSFKLALHAG